MYDHITKFLDIWLSADMILLDVSKAFDDVCHKQLAIKLHAVKLEEKSLLWIHEFLYLLSQCVQSFHDSVNHILSSSVHVLNGVPQGSILDPILFNNFINDTPSTDNSKSTLYVDNLKLLGPALSYEEHSLLQNNCQLLGQWARLGFLNSMLQSAISFTLAN